MEIKVFGLKEIEAQLKELGSNTGTRILRTSMLAATKPMLAAAQSNVASISGGSGALHKSLVQRFYAGQKSNSESALPDMGGRFSVRIFPKSADRTAVALHNLFYRRKRKGIFYGHLIEFGHKVVTRGSKVSRGSVAPRPFLKSALNSTGQTAVAILKRELDERIARQLKKNAKQK